MTAARGPQRPRALLLFSQTYAAGGIQRCNQTFLAAAGNLGIEAEVLTLRDPADVVARIDPTPGLHVRGFGGDKLRYLVALARALRSGRYQWVLIGHINLARAVVLLARICCLRAPRLAMLAHGIEVWDGIIGARRKALGAIDLFLCVSRYTRDRIRAQAPGIAQERFIVFTNALSPSWATQPPETLGPHLIGAPPRYLLSVTRLDTRERYKGIITTLQAFAMLPDRDLHYVIAGDGDDLDFLRRTAQRLGVSDRVHFRGRIPDGELAGLYARCQAFVLPSGKEGFGIVFLEAMYFGAPVIAARARGAVDAVEDGVTGLLVDYGDVTALRRALQTLLDDSQLRDRLIRQGRERVTGGGIFTFEAFTSRLASLLPKLADSKDEVAARQIGLSN